MIRPAPVPQSPVRPAIGRIRRRASFRALARPDGRASSGPVRVSYVSSARASEETPGMACIGYAVGRTHGNAVARNRLRRRMRAALRESAGTAGGRWLTPGAYLVSAAPGASGLDARALGDALRSAIQGAAR